MSYERLLSLLDSRGAEYRLIHHAPRQLTGRCRSTVVRLGANRHVLAVVAADQQVALGIFGASARFVSPTMAELLTGCPRDTIIPFSFHPTMRPVVDRSLLVGQEILFAAARRDVSVALNTLDYLRFATPHVADIARLPLAEAA
jgi:Ala-tRNA(Pro) deacylase